MPIRRIVVFGRVQGVGFRAFTHAVATDLEVRGEVWNRRDGCVELIAIHEDDQMLDDFEYRLGRGPGRVDRVSSEPESGHQYDGFDVGATR